MGTLSNGRGTVSFENSHAPGLNWRKAGRTDLDPILKDCVILAAAPDAEGHPHDSIPDGTRMVALSDDKDPTSPVLYFSRAEIRKFFEGVRDGEFDDLMATDAEMEQAAAAV
ncbi:DUF397 domain-containing protein [Streptomyces lunaelactis]|uniref:DUF397 domain-containing protein n=1 Tax=Streptomyces lunaelactis TaxID=1535768 RepID=A0A2R4T493_9ACTN|nr:DUF397 domain-containing protein [Streptomyces lunaelactis]AVZ73911.1 DUF397 domain-containing protein [Streptomyces lunaelactis]NUK03303.1 DUF397 domain-containing protein [Streptomyces lunaelactis]NUK10172.1 DUF397 domain-containing protein [Streptomyces lunaelactis]NUK17653.1 DUF397 domain-containing protein [Streptomyces lunaelactis]NUK24678.1 DUF397 domain-containing protein [Streptomyces lunaelactis]